MILDSANSREIELNRRLCLGGSAALAKGGQV